MAREDVEVTWDPSAGAVIICDMWDRHHCVSAERRVAEIASPMNEVVAQLRRQGALIIHSPSGCTFFYKDTLQRRRAREAPFAPARLPFEWRDWDPAREAALPRSVADPGPCSCSSPDRCCESGEPYPWTRQIDLIEIAGGDAISDDGQEIYNLLETRSVSDLLLMGVHANLCILGRPFGIRQWVYLGKRPSLCRDLTDSFHRHEQGHAYGNELVLKHIEAYWCPTVSSLDLVGAAREDGALREGVRPSDST